MSHVPATWTRKGQNSLTDSATKLQCFRRNAFQGTPGIYYPPPPARINDVELISNTPCFQIMWHFDVWVNNRDSLLTMQSLPMTLVFFLTFSGRLLPFAQRMSELLSSVNLPFRRRKNLTDSEMLRLGLSQRY